MIAWGALGMVGLAQSCNGTTANDASPSTSMTFVGDELSPSTVSTQPTSTPSPLEVTTTTSSINPITASVSSCLAPEIDVGAIGNSIVVVGDSLTVSVESQLHLRLSGVEVLAFRARTMATPLNTDDGAKAFASAPPEIQDRPVRVIALGTNDLWGLQLTRDELVDDARRLLTTLAEASVQQALTIWVLPAMTAPIDDLTRFELAWFVDFLKREARRWNCVFVADWPDEVSRHGTEYLHSDGVHLTEVGQTAFVNLITEEVQRLVDEDRGIDNM